MHWNLKSLTLVILLFSEQAFSEIVWSWEINNPSVIVQPDEIVVFYATLHNHINSEPLSNLDAETPTIVGNISLLTRTSDSNIYSEYIYDYGAPGSGNIDSQFSGVTLLPGDSYEFILYSLVPRDGSVEPSLYSIDFHSLSLARSPVVNAPLSTNITVVPVPSALVLFLSAVIPLFNRKKLTSCGTPPTTLARTR